MKTTIRERLSDALLGGALDRGLDTRELEQNLATVPAAAPGYDAASRAVSSARRLESALLWLGWRLRPRTIRVD